MPQIVTIPRKKTAPSAKLTLSTNVIMGNTSQPKKQSQDIMEKLVTLQESANTHFTLS